MFTSSVDFVVLNFFTTRLGQGLGSWNVSVSVSVSSRTKCPTSRSRLGLGPLRLGSRLGLGLKGLVPIPANYFCVFNASFSVLSLVTPLFSPFENFSVYANEISVRGSFCSTYAVVYHISRFLVLIGLLFSAFSVNFPFGFIRWRRSWRTSHDSQPAEQP